MREKIIGNILRESRQQEASESLKNEDARQTRAPHAPPRRVDRGHVDLRDSA